MAKLEYHEAANIFPMLKGDALDQFAAKAKEQYAKEAKERKRAAGEKHGRGQKVPVNLPGANDAGDARDKAGEALGVSGKSVDYAAKTLADGCDEGRERKRVDKKTPGRQNNGRKRWLPWQRPR
jgi:hypothetical protein